MSLSNKWETLFLRPGVLNDLALESAIIDEVSMSENPDLPMKIGLVNDTLIMNSNLKPVYDHISFNKNNLPNEGGIFSNDIFGYTSEELKRTFAYIDLGEKFFHPYVYEILKSVLGKPFEKCASGVGLWEINNEGKLKEIISDDSDTGFGEPNTGVSWLIENYGKIVFTDSDSLTRKDRIHFLNSLKKSDFIISKWLVIPVYYRDVDRTTRNYKLPEIDVEYNHIIRNTNTLKNSVFGGFDNGIRYNIQMLLVDIRKRAQKLLEKKHGFFHKGILGKSTDRGARDVISTNVLVGCKKPDDNPVDVFHTGIPLAKCMILGYDFVMRYCIDFFNANFKDMKEYPVYDIVDGAYKMVGKIPVKDQLLIYTTKYIEKKIKQYKNSHETRFETIKIKTEDGKEIPFHFTGLFGDLPSPGKDNNRTISARPMTWTDLFYMACYNTLRDKSVYITRYPITSHNSIFPTLCYPLSTIKTMRAEIDGIVYDRYPVVDLLARNISNLFNDTVTFSNLFLSAIGGDFNGDTTSEKMCFSLEANQEALDIAESVKSFITPQGKMLRTLGNEAYLCYYNMTRDNPAGPILTKEQKEELLKLSKDSLTIDSIARLFGTTTIMDRSKSKNGFKTNPPKFNPRSKLVLEANEYTNQTQVVTTVGKFLFNKLLIEGNIESIIPNGYYNVEVNKKAFGKLEDYITSGVMDGKIHIRPHMATFLKANEFWGLGLVTIFAPSYSLETIIPNKQLASMKKKMLNEKKDNSLVSLMHIEDTLVEEAGKILQNTPGKFLFDSGARGSFDNDYKNMQISVGPVQNAITGDYDFMESNYMGGISKKDLPAAANSIVAAEYPKAIGTAKGGYMVKQFYSVYQSITIGDYGSDCGAVNGLEVVITKDNLSDYIYQYIITKSGLLQITDKLSSEYMNKPVFIRSPMYCIAEKICSKCAGERFYKVGIDNLGLTTPALTGAIMNASMKLRHNMKLSLDIVNDDNLFIVK